MLPLVRFRPGEWKRGYSVWRRCRSTTGVRLRRRRQAVGRAKQDGLPARSQKWERDCGPDVNAIDVARRVQDMGPSARFWIKAPTG